MFRAPARESGLGAFIQLRWDSSQASVSALLPPIDTLHLPHPVIAYSWDTALNLVAYPVISYNQPFVRGWYYSAIHINLKPGFPDGH